VFSNHSGGKIPARKADQYEMKKTCNNASASLLKGLEQIVWPQITLAWHV
jgi:hypothetical protein